MKRLKCSVYETEFDYVNGGGIALKLYFSGQSSINKKRNPVSDKELEIIENELNGYNCTHIYLGLIQIQNNWKISIEDFYAPIETAFLKAGITLIPTFYAPKRYCGGATSLI